MAARLFPSLLGADFETLMPLAQALHRAAPGTRFIGRCSIERGTHPLGKLIGAAARLPSAGEVDVEIRIDADAMGERWRRRFGRHLMPSRLWAADGRLREQLGLVTFDFALSAQAGALCWRVVAVRGLGMPLPARWFAGVTAVEPQRDGRYAFDVRAALPGIGLLVHYRGTLDAG